MDKLKTIIKKEKSFSGNLAIDLNPAIDLQDYSINGLSDREAKERLTKFGPNTLVSKSKTSAFKIFAEQFSDFMVLILLGATAISAFMGETMEAITIFAIVIVNAILGFIQEFRTEKTLEALKNLAAPLAKVVREGKIQSISAENIVPGDIILLEAGDRVPADAILIEANNVSADESLLTGESVPVEKKAAKKRIKSYAFDDAQSLNHVYMGTNITSGRAKAVVISTGMKTEMGKIAHMLQDIEEDETPLQKKLAHLGKFIVYGCLGICAVVSVTGIIRGEDIFDMFLAGISLAVAAVPEGLPAIVTISLALGVQRMLKRNALIRKLPAVETLGCANIICSDKTGTLTENKMTVKKVYVHQNMIDVTGIGYDVNGEFYINGKKIDPIKNAPIRLCLEIGVLCNNTQLIKAKAKSQIKSKTGKPSNSGIRSKIKSIFSMHDNWIIEGDPTEGALLVAAAKAGITSEILNNQYERYDEIPFDSDRKCMSVLCRNLKGERYIFTKGAPDVIIKKCNKIYTRTGIVNLTNTMKEQILKMNDNMAGEALRVLGMAFKKLDETDDKLPQKMESDLIFVGLQGMIDPPREEVLEAVRKCKMAGIKPVMITGDHKLTACAIAKELQIFNEGDKVLTGNDLEKMDETALLEEVENVSVFARVSPKHKLSIVRAFKRLGYIVAMTGDGVNDAPAVKEADIGVAMGIMGTDVTKEASSMILMDDNFATIVAAVEEGRVIYNNIRKFIRYLLSCNIGEVLTMFLGMLLGLPIPLFPIQILWVNLVTDGLPAIALSLEPADKEAMMKPPRSTKDNIFSHGLIHLIVIRGILLGLSTLGVFISVLHFTHNVELARTAGFVTLVITQLIHVFECKSESRSIFEIPFLNNIYLILAVCCSLIMILAVVYIPVLQGIFKTLPLTYNEWLFIIGFSSIGPIGSSLFRRR